MGALLSSSGGKLGDLIDLVSIAADDRDKGKGASHLGVPVRMLHLT